MSAGPRCWTDWLSANRVRVKKMSESEQRLQRAVQGFLAAFRNLSWDSFLGAFDNGATVFFPFAGLPRRASGIEEIAAGFTPLFESLRNQHPAGPPYLPLVPLDLRMTVSGHMALITFHIDDSADERATLCRRTMVWIDDGSQWRILHLHASNMPAELR